METTPLLSIIIPVFNCAEYIVQTLSSITKNMTSEVEIILVDDGSTDDSATLLERFHQQTQYSTKIILQKNQGVAAARNRGVQEASGDYIGFVDADDLIHDDYFAVLLPLLKTYKYDIVDFKWQRFQSIAPTPDKIDKVITQAFTLLLGKRLPLLPIFQQGQWHLFIRIFKRSLLHEECFEPGRRYEDIAFTPFQYLKDISLLRLDHVLYYYRNNHQSITNNFRPQDALDILFAMNKMIRLIEQNREDEQLYQLGSWMILNCFLEARKAFRKAHGFYNYDEQSIKDIKKAAEICNPKIISKQISFRMRYPECDLYFSKFKWHLKQRLS